MPRLSTRTRLLLITTFPLLVLFVTLTWYSHQSRQEEVRAELAERGQLLAAALASSGEASLMGGQFDELKASIYGMMQGDSAIKRVTLLDASRKPLVDVEARTSGQPEARYFEAPIHKRLLYVTGGGDRNVGTMGYVQVRMSATALLAKQRRRFYIELGVASLGLLLCLSLAYRMTDGFAASLKSSMQALRAADEEKRRLLQRVNTAVEDERKSIALEIHDELNATLIAVRLEAQQITALAAQAQPAPLAGQIGDKARAITRLALGLYNSGRSLVRRLRPEVLDMLGLQGALEEMVNQYERNHPDCHFALQAQGDFAGLDGNVAISAYRIVQEALSNIVKHARARNATVALLRRDGRLEIAVADDGVGFDPAHTAEGIGIAGMKERVQALGGRFAIATANGTRIAISLPLES
ncbi:ATP-binding protein [Pseudoduganella sp. RAF19]|uniref:ATP-binding protein n=1 Tax=Pseudoduganella sp. RAF19 TaxID=3233052 RepID=UPI003F969CB4